MEKMVEFTVDQNYYNDEVVWKKLLPNYACRIPVRNNYTFKLSCMPLNQIKNLILNEFFTITDVTESDFIKYNGDDFGSKVRKFEGSRSVCAI